MLHLILLANVDTQGFLRQRCSEIISKDEWGPGSGDMSVLDYLIFGIVEADAKSQEHANEESLW